MMPKRRLLLFYGTALAASLLPALLSAFLVWQLRASDYAASRRSAGSIARLIADDFQNEFDQLDRLMRSIGRQYVDGAGSGPEERSRLAKHVQEEMADFPSVARILVADSTGRLVLGGGDLKGGLSGAEDHVGPQVFAKAAAGGLGLSYTGPIRSRFSPGDWVIALSRRLEDGSGNFLGVVVACLPVEYFEQRLAAVDLQHHDVIVFRTSAGAQVARYSLELGERGVTGDDKISGELTGLIKQPGLDHAFYETLAPQDNVQRLYAYQRLSHAPFFLLVGQPQTMLDQSWRRLALALGLLCCGGAVVLMWIARRLLNSTESLRRAEKALRSSQLRLQHAADAARLTYVQFKPRKNFVQLAENFGQVMGFKPRTPPEGGTFEGARSGLLAHAAAPDKATVAAMFRDIAAGLGGTHRFRVIGDDGVTRWFESIYGPEKNSQGVARVVFATLLDLTSLVDVQTALESAKAKADEILESIGDSFFALDSQWRFSYFNGHAAKMVGKTAADVLGQPLFAVFPEFEGTKVHANFKKVIAENRALSFELISPVIDRWVSFSVYPTREGGISVYFKDVEKKKAAEKALVNATRQAERANLAKSRFLAAASHDLRQPVQSLVLLLGLIERQVKENPKATATAGLMQQALAGLNGLLTAILDISRLDAGVVEAAPEVVELDSLLERLTGEYQAKAEAKGLRWRFAPSGLQTYVDPLLLERALRNLMENALRYTVEGAILVGVRRRDERVRIDIVDTGIGIPEDRLTDIFEEFVQLDNPGRDLGLGLGLGLAIIARLADLMGAKVEVASKLGKGSRFSLWLPRIRTAAAPKPAAPHIGDAGGRLLVVEDNDILREILSCMIESWGYETIVAGSGEEALKKAAALEWRLDAIVSDQRLGSGLTGVETAREIERLAGRSLPTLILTGDTAAKEISEITSSGFALLHKPVSEDALRQTLAATIVDRR